MSERDLLNRSIEAGRDVTPRTQDRIEALVREVAKVAEDQAAQAQQVLQELVEVSRSITEQVVEVIDRELRHQINALGLATRTDIDRLEERLDPPPAPAPAVAATKKAAPRKKAATKKAATRKA